MSRNGTTRKYEVGDRFVLRGEVVSVGACDESYRCLVGVRFDGSPPIYFAASTLDFVKDYTPAPLKIGDLVSAARYGWKHGEIRAIDGDHAWVRWDGSGYCSHCFDDLERVPQ